MKSSLLKIVTLVVGLFSQVCGAQPLSSRLNNPPKIERTGLSSAQMVQIQEAKSQGATVVFLASYKEAVCESQQQGHRHLLVCPRGHRALAPK